MTQLEETKLSLGSLVAFETKSGDRIVLHVKKAILPTRPHQEYFELYFDDEGKFLYII